jgi:DNA invertase Pin-like site-specific DNA recombinase
MVRSYRPNREQRRGRQGLTLNEDVHYRVAIYARISTGEGMQSEGHSIDAQLRICREFAQRRGWTIVEEYVDEGYSGSKDDRPAFLRMIDDAFAGHFQVIVFHKLDRFSRSISDILHYFDLLERNDILIASATEAFDFSDPADRAKFHMLAVFAQWYIDNLAAETRKGKKQRVLNGLHNGRLPFGYTKIEGQEHGAIVPEEAEVIQEAYEAYATEQYSDREIAELINLRGFETRTGRHWSKDSVRDFLQNEFYMGYVKYKDKIYRGRHEAIISEELFEAVQDAREKRSRAPRSYSPKFRTYILGRIIHCDTCGESLRSQSAGGDYRYYREMSHTRGLECPDSGSTVNADIAEEQMGALLGRLRLPEDWQDSIRDNLLSDDKRQQVLERKAYLEGKLERLAETYADGIITKDDYEQERDAIRNELKTLVIPEDVAVLDAGLYLETLDTLWAAATDEEKEKICKTMLEKVYYDVPNERITRLVPYPAFQPLFRKLEELQEVEHGEFQVLTGEQG